MRQGRFYHENLEWLEGVEITDIIDAYTDAFEMDTERFVEAGEGYYIRVLLTRLAQGGERDQAFEMIDRIEPYGDEALVASVDGLRQSLFENPQARIDFSESRTHSGEGGERIEMRTYL